MYFQWTFIGRFPPPPLFVGQNFMIFRATSVHLGRRRAVSVFSYAKPNKQARFSAATFFDGFEPERREFECLRSLLRRLNELNGSPGCLVFLWNNRDNLSVCDKTALQKTFQLLGISLNQCGLVKRINNPTGLEIVAIVIMDVIREFLCSERALTHAVGHDSVCRQRFQRVFGMQQQTVAEIQRPSYLVVVQLPSQLHETAAIVHICELCAIRIRDGDRLAVGSVLSLTEFLNWLPAIGALVFNCGKHIGRTANIRDVWILL